MKHLILFFSFLHPWLATFAYTQGRIDETSFRTLSSKERCRLIGEFDWNALDSLDFIDQYRRLLAVAQSEKDEASVWGIQFRYYQRAEKSHDSADILRLETELHDLAVRDGLNAERIVIGHFTAFRRYHKGEWPFERLYAHIIQEYEEMKQTGFDQFTKYEVDRLLFHFARFMYKLEDYEKALTYLQTAEQYASSQPVKGLQTWVWINNYFQSIYQQQNQTEKALKYARKIFQVVSEYPATDEAQINFCRIWQGISAIDIAQYFCQTGRCAEGENYAAIGQELIKNGANPNMIDLRAEYNMLQVLIEIKLALGKLDEAAALFRRLDAIVPILDREEEPDYFKHIKYYQNYARYYELSGNFSVSLRYLHLLQPIQDSLERRNDARKLVKIQQRLEAEKYTEKIAMVERERTLQQRLKYLAFVLLLMAMAGASYMVLRLREKRKQALHELDSAKQALGEYTKTLREKSEQAEKLRLEIERLSNSGQRSEYLEQLTQSTILTDDDWSRFRNLFERVYPNYIAEQKRLYPELTQAELRYLALTQLQLTTREMADMLGVSDGTIRQTRLRLKRKMNSSVDA